MCPNIHPHTSSNPLIYTFMINETTRAVILEYRYMCVGAWRFFYLLTVLHRLYICNILFLSWYSPPNLKCSMLQYLHESLISNQIVVSVKVTLGWHEVLPAKQNTSVKRGESGWCSHTDIIVKTSRFIFSLNFTGLAPNHNQLPEPNKQFIVTRVISVQCVLRHTW